MRAQPLNRKLVLLLGVAISVVVWFALTATARADHGGLPLVPHPYPGVAPSGPWTIPPHFMDPGRSDSIPNCNDHGWIPLGRLNIFDVWLSSPPSTTSQTWPPVNPGTPSVSVKFNRIMVNCFNSGQTGNLWITNTQYRVKGVSAGVSGIGAGTDLDTPVTNGHIAGALGHGSIDFTYSPPGGFIASGTHTVTIEVKIVYARSNGTFACANGAAVSGYANDGICPTTFLSLNFFVPVLDVCPNIAGAQASPPSGYHQWTDGNCYVHDSQPTMWAGADCANTRVSVWSEDANGNTYDIYAQINGGGYFPVGRDPSGWFFVPMAAANRYAANTINIITWGTHPPDVNPYTTQYNAWDITYGPCYVTVQGRVTNAYDRNTGYNGVTINTCITGLSATTYTESSGRAGWFTFDVPVGSGYCVRVSGDLHSSAAQNVRPWGVGYTTSCGAYGAATASPNYCTAYGTYEYQIAGVHDTTTPTWSTYDRSVDTGFDVVFRYAPSISCSLQDGDTTMQPGEIFNPTVRVVNTGSTLTRPPVTSGTVTVTAAPQGARTANYTGIPDPPLYVDVFVGGGVPLPASNPTATIGATAVGDGLTGTASCNQSLLIGNHSYMKAYGGDVWAGGGFTPSCSATSGSGHIYGFAEDIDTPVVGDYRGSSAQFGVTALLTINEFYSVNTREPGVGNTFPPKALTFANTGSSTYGGDFASGGRCITDYWNSTRDTGLGTTAFNANAIPANAGRIQYQNGVDATGVYALDIGGPSAVVTLTVPIGTQAAIFVEGNVQINDNIFYSGGPYTTTPTPPTCPPGTTLWSGQCYFEEGAPASGGNCSVFGLPPAVPGPFGVSCYVITAPTTTGVPMPNRAALPYLVIIACGTIKIDNDVSRIDAVLIAQPGRMVGGRCVNDASTPASSGTIYTCTNQSGVLYLADTLYNECSGTASTGDTRQLTINGALIARRVKFQRVFGSLNGAAAREKPNFGTGRPDGSNSISAAEIINYTPEVYMAPSPLRHPSGTNSSSTAGRYDAITGLPPIY